MYETNCLSGVLHEWASATQSVGQLVQTSVDRRRVTAKASASQCHMQTKHRVHLPLLAVLAQKLVLKSGWMVPLSIPASIRSCCRVCANLQCLPRGQLPLSKKSLHQLVLKSSGRCPYTQCGTQFGLLE